MLGDEMNDDDNLSKILVIDADRPAILVVATDTELAIRLNRLFNLTEVADSSKIPGQPNYAVRCADTPALAEQLIAEGLSNNSPFNLVFVLHPLRQASGVALIKRLWEVDSGLNAVLCNADPELDWPQIAEKLGESDQLLILQQPFSDLVVRQVVHAMVRQWQLVKQTQDVMQFMVMQNRQLEATNHKLQDIQAQLLQSEKMSSIGQLAAGVAHEINNPVGFVKSNLNTLKRYIADLLELAGAYEKAESAVADAWLMAGIDAVKRRIDLDYLRHDAPELLEESLDGINRVTKIVQDLKEFSHPQHNKDDWQWADLHAGLDSALNIVYNELKYKAEIVKRYGDVPLVNCLPRQLNQVFVNLLVNAAYAIEKHGVITVATGCGDGRVWIEIGDTGCGMTEEQLGRIFDAFYTTKPVGKGTGLGLTISYGIVKKHGGDIKVRSRVGSGTTLRIELPVDAETAQ
ncbi:ATP-binding protein [Methylomonas sp. SURF-1]|uniref:histidine kinase n=1 Tax=Methylomonas aurea TaxID=2952224 RepID=A0ABT1UHM8_9GAMM|nr:ATP-binding protein [Methylomonas sp. SURF-1]MCQ8181725.1 ATP-binding protein [Methylomonas sp. SURF-1]